jgi:hypothetical protein
MRATTQLAFINAVRLFLAHTLPEQHPGESERIQPADILAAVQAAWTAYEEERAGDSGPLFAGAEYNPARDDQRLLRQMGRVFDVMADGNWHALAEIAERTGDPPASVSAQLRHLRKPQHGSWIIERRSSGVSAALFLYRLRNPDGSELERTLPV